MICEIIIIGTEIVKGQILDTNSKYLSSVLSDMGYKINFITAVDDNYERIYNTIRTAYERSDVIILTGGLGPTSDDITREICADLFKRKLIFRKKLKNKIEEHFRKRNLSMPLINIKQAYIPKGALVLNNNVGTAPGFIIEENKKSIIVMPGVPKEMTDMMENYVRRYLQRKLAKNRLFSKTIIIYGKPESYIASKLSRLEKEAKKDEVEIGYIAHYGSVDCRISSYDKSKIKKYLKKIKKLIPTQIIDDTGNKLEYQIGEMLRKMHKRLVVAESCTGGLISKTITDIPGSSDYFTGGFITYSNEMKIKILEVTRKVLDKYGAVSKQCAEQMAEGAKKLSGADFAIATTDIAGPGGGSQNKPAGTVFISLLDDKNKIITKKYFFTGDRELVRYKTMRAALLILRESILQRAKQ